MDFFLFFVTFQICNHEVHLLEFHPRQSGTVTFGSKYISRSDIIRCNDFKYIYQLCY